MVKLKYQHKTNGSIIEYLSTDLAEDNSIVFHFNDSYNKIISIPQKEFSNNYSRWIDPWAAQKAICEKYGVKWLDEALPPTPSFKLSF